MNKKQTTSISVVVISLLAALYYLGGWQVLAGVLLAMGITSFVLFIIFVVLD